MRQPDLYPIAFERLVARLARELEAGGDLYYLPRRSWWVPDPDADTSVTHLGRRIATPAGPASGPHTQLAQNLVLSWLSGGRFMELKTVQILDELEIPRPCIHAPHVGYNVEWSQELLVHQSALEYAKGWWLVHMLASEHGPGLWPGVDCTFDVSVGYDLAGLRSPKVKGYLDQMRDASALLDQLRAELPPELAKWAAVPVPTQISDSLTISTFHGCPAHEIEAIARQCLEWGWNTVIKLNPTLLGYDTVRGLLDQMGYHDIALHSADFEKDLSWSQLLEMIPRLQALAAEKGLGFGVKLTNTLVCTSPEPPFTQDEMYLSGPPLHVISTQVAARVADAFPGLPMTFSAGIDAKNFVDTIASGIAVATSCTDLLKVRGYARMTQYVRNLEAAVKKAGGMSALQVDLQARAAALPADTRYHRVSNHKAPPKVGSSLVLLDCLTCDKCIPVCPNAANFSVVLPQGEWNPGRVSWSDGAFETHEGRTMVVAKKHQIANTADACNLCGHCDTWCPEDGGPYIVKPTVFVTREAFDTLTDRYGFFVEDEQDTIHWRREDHTLSYRRLPNGTAILQVPGGSLTLRDDVPESSAGRGDVDLVDAVTLRLYLDALTAPEAAAW